MSKRRDLKSRRLQTATAASADLAEGAARMRLGWRILLTLLLLALIALLGMAGAATSRVGAASLRRPAAQSTGDPLVLAFYYTWFDEATWSRDQLSDLPAQPYVSRDRGVMGRHIDQAKAAGIDAFLVAWYGPNGSSNQTEANLKALLEEAAARSFRIGILFETDSPFMGGSGDAAAALRHAAAVHFTQPAYLRVDGRPVVFFWRPTRYGVDDWRAIRGEVDGSYGSLWIAEGVDTSYLAVFDGHYLYSNTWNPPADLNTTNQKFARRVEEARQQSGVFKFWVATVMPGYNDVRVRPGVGFLRDREDGAYYSQSWSAAIDSRPNWIVITSFNEWPEGTYIEPSEAHGDRYLGLTAAWSQQFKAGGVSAAALPLPAPPPTATPQSTPAAPTAYVVSDLVNLRAAPSTESPIVGQAAAGTALSITGVDPAAPDWWQVKTQSDGAAWVYGALVEAAGPLESVEAVNGPLLAPGPLIDPTQTALHPLLSRQP